VRSTIGLLDAKELAAIAEVGFREEGDWIVKVRDHAPILGYTLMPSKTGIFAGDGNVLFWEVND
jgi:hypothetical protein